MYIRGNVYFGITVFSCLSSTKSCLEFVLICFDWEIKGFYQSSLGNEVDFTNIMNVSPNILRHGFVDKNGINIFLSPEKTSFCHRKTLVLFCFRMKGPENAYLTITVNYRTVVQKNKLWHSKQH